MKAAVMWALYWTGVVKRELNLKVKLLVYQSIYVPALNHVQNEIPL